MGKLLAPGALVHAQHVYAGFRDRRTSPPRNKQFGFHILSHPMAQKGFFYRKKLFLEIRFFFAFHVALGVCLLLFFCCATLYINGCVLFLEGSAFLFCCLGGG